MSFWGGRRNVLENGRSLGLEGVLSSQFSVLSEKPSVLTEN